MVSDTTTESGRWDSFTILQSCGKMRTADFLFQLPEKPNIDRYSLLDGVPCAEQGRERRTLVIRRTTTVIHPVLVLERKGRLRPFRLLRRLHIHMVIDGDRRMMDSGHQAAGHDRIAAGLHNLGVSPQIGEDLPREFRHAPDVGGLGRVHADRRNLHHLAQQIFKPAAAVCDVAFKACAIDHG